MWDDTVGLCCCTGSENRLSHEIQFRTGTGSGEMRYRVFSKAALAKFILFSQMNSVFGNFRIPDQVATSTFHFILGWQKVIKDTDGLLCPYPVDADEVRDKS